MIGFGSALLSVVLWTGIAQVDAMIWEGGGEHPYTTDFALEYYSASARHRVRYEFNVKWDLHRVVE